MEDQVEKTASDIRIVDESGDGELRYQLYVNGSRQAAVIKRRGGEHIGIHWHIYGRQRWPDAKDLIQGLLELSIIADKLHKEEENRERHPPVQRRRKA